MWCSLVTWTVPHLYQLNRGNSCSKSCSQFTKPSWCWGLIHWILDVAPRETVAVKSGSWPFSANPCTGNVCTALVPHGHISRTVLLVLYVISVERGLIVSSQRAACSEVHHNLERGIIQSLRRVVPVLLSSCLFNQPTPQITGDDFVILNIKVIYYIVIVKNLLQVYTFLTFPEAVMYAHTFFFNRSDVVA
jgi:hypothetical protein